MQVSSEVNVFVTPCIYYVVTYKLVNYFNNLLRNAGSFNNFECNNTQFDKFVKGQ